MPWWSPRRESNAWPRPYQGRALPTELHGLEVYYISWGQELTPSSCFSTIKKNSNLPYPNKFRAGDGIWTRDSQLGRLELYHWATPAEFFRASFHSGFSKPPPYWSFNIPYLWMIASDIFPRHLHGHWWAGKGSNLGSRWQQIYSLPPLTAWVPAHYSLMGLS